MAIGKNVLAALLGTGDIFPPVPPLTVSQIGNYLVNPFGSGLIGYYDCLATSDGFLYVSSQKRGSLICFNVQNPSNITYVGEGAAVGTDCRFISSPDDGNTIYVACGGAGNSVYKFDCSARTAPVASGHLTDATNLRQAIVVLSKTANLAFTAGIGASSSSGNGLINALDTSGANPVLTSTVSDVRLRNAQYACLAGAGNKFLVVTGVGGGGSIPNITVWDVSTPSAITFVAEVDFAQSPTCPVYSNGYLYVPAADTNPVTQWQLYVYSMDPTTGALAFVAKCQAGVGQKIIKVGNYIWGCGQWGLTSFTSSGFWAVNVANPAAPFPAYASPQTMSEARPIYNVTGQSVLYVAEDTGAKLHTYTISPIS